MNNKEIELIVCFTDYTWEIKKQYISEEMHSSRDRDSIEEYLESILGEEYKKFNKTVARVMVTWWGPIVKKTFCRNLK